MARYANVNSHPIIIQNPRGGSEFMRAGEFRDGGWWSRFEASGHLTKVPDNWTPTRDFVPRMDKKKVNQLRAPVVVPPGVQPGAALGPCSTGCEASCQIACESGEQAIVVHEHHEQVGKEFYCRYCDWSTKDETTVMPHLKNYHQGKMGKQPVPAKQPVAVKKAPPPQKKRAATEESPGTGPAKPALQAVDPGEPGKDGTTPAQGSLPSGSKSRKKSPDSNEFWRLDDVDGLFHCLKCQPPSRYPWSTVNKGAMVRHAKSVHSYETGAVGVE